MPQIHNQLTSGILSKALTAAVGDSRGSAGLERFSETLDANIDLWSRPEFAILRGETLIGQVASVPAVVAELGGAAIVNPAGSGMLAVIFCLIRSGAAVNWAWGLGFEATILATYASVQLGNFCDGRKYRDGTFGGAAGNLLLATGSDPAGVIQIQTDQLSTPAAGDQERATHAPLIIKPGQAAILTCLTVNTGGTAIFTGYFRRANKGELF